MKLTVALGKEHPARIVKQAELTWDEYVRLLSTAPESDDKASRGWSCPARFSPVYRDSENLQARYALTLDYDHVTDAGIARVFEILKDRVYFAYTTWSHTPEKPRWRVVVPFNRPATYDEFQAVSRQVAAKAGIELAARESHVPAQMMFLPTVRPGEKMLSRLNGGEIPRLDVDAVLAEYADWTDKTSWPRRADADGVHEHGESIDPRTKPGVIGAFCRAYSVPEAIAHFRLPYVPTKDPDRWTYLHGSRPEGVVIYDDQTKAHSHHDTDPARGQNNAFDLVRLHLFGLYDTEEDAAKPVTERPSFRLMVEEVSKDDAVRAAAAAAEFSDLGPMPDAPEGSVAQEASQSGLARHIREVWQTPTQTRWLPGLRDELEHGVMALMAGPRGSFKSFKAIHWAMRVAAEGRPVYVVSAEGGDFGRRAEAWAKHYGIRAALEGTLPLYVVERRLDLNTHDGVEAIRKDCTRLGIRPALFVLDTFSKLSGGLDENDNSAVKLFLGRLDNGLKRPAPQAFDATVLLVAHTGHSDSGRARGASALEADTDACYIVARDPVGGTVRVSRERFKSSPELPPLVYKPAIVDLGRCDEDLVPVTSVILEPVEGGADGARKSQGPKGRNQKHLWQVLREIAPDGTHVDVGKLIDMAVARLPRDAAGGRDLRRQGCRRALDSLLVDGHVFLHEDDTISLSPAAKSDDEEWLE